MMNMFIWIYKGSVSAFTWSRVHFVDLFNESCIIACTIHLMFYTDWVLDAEIQYAYGWSMIVIMCLNIFINVLCILYHAIKNLFLILTKWKRIIGRTLTKWLKSYDDWINNKKIIPQPDLNNNRLGTGMFSIREDSNESKDDSIM